MCGIAGFWGPADRGLLEAMNACIVHRGPDGVGFLETESASLGGRRLAIIDIAGGDQPVVNEDCSVQCVHNGEIYNFRELRTELEAAGHSFRTRCDTEVIVHAYEEWGDECFARFNGMWGIAILDLRQRPRLVLSRDHFGIKPLYYARSGDRLLWASEVKSLLQDRSLRVSPSDQLVHDYLVAGLHDHVPGSFFEGVRSLRAATYAVVDVTGIEERAYWHPRLDESAGWDPAGFREVFQRSVERRLVSDVPVGSCLSGGIDSGSVVGVMADLLQRHVPDAVSMGEHLKTFTAVFDGDPIDESAYVEKVVALTGAESHLCRPTSDDFVRELDRVVWHWEEPVVTTAPFAQWCVMRLASEHVTVVLDGQGGDELLAGYTPYQLVYLRQLLRERRFAHLLSESWTSRDIVWPLVRRRLGGRRFPVRRLIRPEFSAGVAPPHDDRVQDDLKVRLLQDVTTFSLPSVLRYEDRNSMAFSLEARVPFLDQELVEYVLRLPPRAIIDRGFSRAIVRAAMADSLPPEVRLRRKKIGFTTPEYRWLRAKRAWVQGFLRSPATVSRPYWDALGLAAAFDRACQGDLEEHPFVWRAMNVEAWLRVFFSPQGGVHTGRRPEAGLERVGDELAAALAGTREAAEALAGFPINPGRHVFQAARSPAAATDEPAGIYARATLRSRVLGAGDDIEAAIREALGDLEIRPGDVLTVGEKALSMTQGRSVPVDQIHPGFWARLLVRGVRPTPYGIGISMPETMQLAVEEVGVPRLLLAAVVGAVARPFGGRGVFYRIAGPGATTIDGPAHYNLPPADTMAKKAPLEPETVATRLAESLGCQVVIVDANDLGFAWLGASPGADTQLVGELLRDNPTGQSLEQTPFVLIRRAGQMPVGGAHPALEREAVAPEVR
jgi:asparagine synthase (glutamine-hydrolysing)